MRQAAVAFALAAILAGESHAQIQQISPACWQVTNIGQPANAADGSTALSAQCPAGTYVTGGGFSVGLGNGVPIGSHPINTWGPASGWHCVFRDSKPGSNKDCYAICCRR